MSRLNENTVLNIKNKSHAVTAEITARDAKASGAVIVQGGRFGGWCIYLESGVPAHRCNYLHRFCQQPIRLKDVYLGLTPAGRMYASALRLRCIAKFIFKRVLNGPEYSRVPKRGAPAS
jgi:hypothetical protein